MHYNAFMAIAVGSLVLNSIETREKGTEQLGVVLRKGQREIFDHEMGMLTEDVVLVLTQMGSVWWNMANCTLLDSCTGDDNE
tara:strand:+ start:309 stop:554 length:246 start_codon:yes stop_codon:yes gene_type:complete